MCHVFGLVAVPDDLERDTENETIVALQWDRKSAVDAGPPVGSTLLLVLVRKVRIGRHFAHGNAAPQGIRVLHVGELAELLAFSSWPH